MRDKSRKTCLTVVGTVYCTVDYTAQIVGGGTGGDEVIVIVYHGVGMGGELF